eukprot:gene9628-10616_t
MENRGTKIEDETSHPRSPCGGLVGDSNNEAGCLGQTTPVQVCRICYNGSEEEPLLSPCCCAGSIKYLHQTCLLKWLKARKPVCELCQYKYTILKKTKKYEEWSELNQDISVVNYGDKAVYDEELGIFLRLVEKYASLLEEYRKIMDVVVQIE